MFTAIWHGALSGLLAAVMVDYAAFRTWQSFEAAKSYNWSVAIWRWLQGAVSGAVAGAGLGAAGV